MSRLHAIIILTIFSISVGQAQNLKQSLKYAKENHEKGDYYGAIQFYEKAMEFDSASIDLLYNYALALKDYKNYPKAAFYFEKVMDKGFGKIHPEAIYWLAVMQKNMGDYRQSMKTWKQVRRSLGRKRKSYYYGKSKQEIKSCNWANKTYKDSTDWNIESADINTYSSEFAPFPFGEDLYFSSLRSSQSDEGFIVEDDDYLIEIFKADSSSEIIELDTIINSAVGNNGEASISPDGNRLYFTRCVTGSPCQIYISRNKNGKWSQPVRIGQINDPEYSSVQPHIAALGNKEYLFFSSNREGGEGNMDIWYSEVSSEGNKYSKPKNCGSQVNTPDDEISPFYDGSTKTLYFSSTWHNGYGGMDVFRSNGTPKKLGKPRNMKAPINSRANDMYFKLKDENTGYVVSNRVGSLSKPHGTCCNDIFVLTMPSEVKEDTIQTLEDLNRFLPVTLYFHNDRPNPNSLDTSTSLNYLTTYDRYVDLIPKYKTEYSSGLEGEDAQEARDAIDNFFIDYVEKGVSDLEMFCELLMIELEKGLKIEMTVQGYASPLAATEYNVKLTYRRISSMINFLKNYDGGIMAPYIEGTASNGGSLTFVQVPFGEYTADQTISDNRLDQKHSVYSVGAGLERKIEIQSVQIANKADSTYAEIHFIKEVHNFGVLSEPGDLECNFTYTNTGDLPLTIDSLINECECLEVEYSSEPISPGQKAMINVKLDPTGKYGKNMIPFTVVTNGFPKKKQLGVTFDLEESN